MTIPAQPFREIFDAIARTTDDPRRSVALFTVVDVIDMEMIPTEVFADVLTSKTTISDVMDQSASVLAAAMEDDLAHGRDDAEINRELIADMRSAATTLRA